MDEEKIMTQHPAGKSGVNISKTKYEAMRTAILAAIDDQGEIAFSDLATAVTPLLPESFDGSVGWYVTTVKLDLEARGEIERTPGKTPQHLRRVDASSA